MPYRGASAVVRGKCRAAAVATRQRPAESIRGQPCYGVGDANVVILQEFADHLMLAFFKGILLDDPADALQEQGPNMHAARRLTFTSVEEIRRLADVVRAYLGPAIAWGIRARRCRLGRTRHWRTNSRKDWPAISTHAGPPT